MFTENRQSLERERRMAERWHSLELTKPSPGALRP